MVEFLIALVFLAVILVAVYWIMSLPMFASIPPQIKNLIYLIIFVVVFVWFLGKVGLMPAGF